MVIIKQKKGRRRKEGLEEDGRGEENKGEGEGKGKSRVVRMERNWNSCVLLMELEKGTATVENYTAVFIKVK